MAAKTSGLRADRAVYLHRDTPRPSRPPRGARLHGSAGRLCRSLLVLYRGASPLELPYTLARGDPARPPPLAWLTHFVRSRLYPLSGGFFPPPSPPPLCPRGPPPPPPPPG